MYLPDNTHGHMEIDDVRVFVVRRKCHGKNVCLRALPKNNIDS